MPQVSDHGPNIGGVTASGGSHTPDAGQPALVGALEERAAELAAIEGAIGSAIAGTGRLVVIEGEPGCGRSALLGWANELAAARGTLTLFGRGLELEHDFSFGLVLQLFGPFIGGAGEDRAALLQGDAAGRVQYWSAGEPDRVWTQARHTRSPTRWGDCWRTSGPTPMQMRCSSRSMTCSGPICPR